MLPILFVPFMWLILVGLGGSGSGTVQLPMLSPPRWDGGICNLPMPTMMSTIGPQDLLQPDLVILLTVSDEERIRRIRKRGLEETKEEKELEDNSIF
ncbi:unnamed protein product [Ranitomeya imitator]|uniref:Uncharacterized protein n=1 Tax=Ranitomeya imitator TaxID=111125 RepID=A0ABN9LSD8_9NEOB|nr:unnamed protein product [Ranitomeya imitator]